MNPNTDFFIFSQTGRANAWLHEIQDWRGGLLGRPWFFGCVHLGSGIRSRARVFFQQVTVIDVERGEARADQSVLVANGLIQAVGPAGELQRPEGAIVVEGQGKFLIPGLWDMHIHWFAPPTMALFPLNGVTGVRVMWGNPGHHQWRKDFRAGKRLGPRMKIASALIDGADPFWAGSRIAQTAAEGTAAVEEAVLANSDFVKVYTLLPREAYLAIAAACRANGLPFAGHVPRMISAKEASELGQKSMEHLYEVRLACSREEAALRSLIEKRVAEGEGVVRAAIRDEEFSRELSRRTAQSFDEQQAQELFETFRKNGTWQCPTLTVLHNLAYLEDPRVQEHPDLKYIPAGMKAFIAPAKDPRNRSAAEFAEDQKRFRENLELVGEMHRAGVPLLAGTDVLNPFCLPGFSLHDELQRLVDAGLSPAAALQTATLNPARYFDEPLAGTIADGKHADLVLLAGNPLEDITRTRQIEGVMLRGRWLGKDEIEERMSKFESR